MEFLLSLITATLTLPGLLPRLRLPPEPSQDAEEDEARAFAGQRAIRAIERLQAELAAGSDEADLVAEAGCITHD